MTLRKPQGFLFDFGSTLVVEPVHDYAAGNAALLATAREGHGVTIEQVEERSAELVGGVLPEHGQSPYEFPAEWFTRLLFERLGVTFDRPALELELIFWEACCQRMAAAPGIHLLLDLLDEQNIPRGVVSNCSFSAEIIAWELRHSALDDRFEFIMSSKDYGFRKPHPEIFLVAAAKLSEAPEDIWFCGDRVERDVEGALGVGMTAVWYNARGEARDGPEPDLEISDWDDLTRKVAQILS